MEEEVVELYKKILDNDEMFFPREYFLDGIGFKRFCICINYLIENYKTFANLEEIYRFFDSDIGKKFLQDHKLKNQSEIYSDCMLDVIKYITQDDPDSELIYNYLLFEHEIGEKKEEETLEEK